MTSLTSQNSDKANVQHAELTTPDESHQVLNADEELLRSLGYKQVRRTTTFALWRSLSKQNV